MTSTGGQIDVPERLDGGAPMFRFAGGTTDDVTIFDRFTIGGQVAVAFEQADKRALVLRDVLPFVSDAVYRDAVGGATLFLEDISGGGYSFKPGTKVWARQWNLEGRGVPKATNDGATLWAMGNKHEGAETILANINGARSEMWAGLAYTFGADKAVPAFVNTDASLAVQMAGTTYMGANGFFDLLIQNSVKGVVIQVRRGQLPGRGGGAWLPLWVSIADQTPQIAANTSENTMKFQTLAATAAIALAPALVAPPNAKIAQAQAAKTYKAPAFFDGEANGKSDGNPLEVGGKKQWEAAQIWPDDIFQRANYKPMNWAGDTWRGAYEFGGQPTVKIVGGTPDLTSRGGWGGDGTMPGLKRAALIFTAPASGNYKVTGTVRSFVWEGDKVGGANLTLLKYDKAADKITRVTQTAAPNETVVPIDETSVDLKADDELILLNAVNSNFTAAAMALGDLKLEFTPGGNRQSRRSKARFDGGSRRQKV